MLPFSISIKSGVPIYEQVIYAVKKAIVIGQLKTGDPFPSVREISRELRINPNTAQKIAVHLVDQGILEIRPGIGSIIAPPQMPSEKEQRDILHTEVERLVVEAKRFAIDKQKLLDAIHQHWDMKGKK